MEHMKRRHGSVCACSPCVTCAKEYSGAAETDDMVRATPRGSFLMPVELHRWVVLLGVLGASRRSNAEARA